MTGRTPVRFRSNALQIHEQSAKLPCLHEGKRRLNREGDKLFEADFYRSRAVITGAFVKLSQGPVYQR